MKKNKYISGKVSVLVLTAAFFVASFLLGKSATTAFATESTHVNDPVITSCGVQDLAFSGFFNEPNEDNDGTNREQFRLKIKLDGTEIYTKDSQGSWTTPSQSISVGSHDVVAQLQHRTSNDHGNHWSNWSNDGDPSDTDNFTVEACEEERVDVCENLDGDQETLPDGMQVDNEYFCSCKDGYHEVNSEGLRVATDGLNNFTCEADDPTPTPYDACFNLEGTQSGIPDGYHKDSEDGACNQYQFGGAPPPSDGGAVLGASTGKVPWSIHNGRDRILHREPVYSYNGTWCNHYSSGCKKFASRSFRSQKSSSG